MSCEFKYYFLMGCSATMAIAGIGGSLTGFYCAALFFCTAMIIDEIGKAKAKPDAEKGK